MKKLLEFQRGMVYNAEYEVIRLKVYMDVCCLNRPFDNQSQDKVRFETEAIVSILKRCGVTGDWELIGSDIITAEILKNPDSAKRQKALMLNDGAARKVKYNPEIKARAAQFRELNIKLFDSLHLAAAEYAGVDVFLTTDARLIKAAARSDIKIRVANPLNYYMEVFNND
ncbi:MAG: PIN domain-containing protein [Oscillospiraceae bacterium]|jgi:hypothetical protein|nr:PIN domain-containing protein [Oscillospiraceae bacterium]